MTEKSLNELKSFLKQYRDEFQRKTIGDFGSGISYAQHMESAIGISINALAGQGPKYVPVDLATGFDLMKPLKKKFDHGFCMDLLEHVDNPFLVAENVSKSIKKNGLLFVTVPFSWEYHEAPIDYWRFTHTGVAKLFEKFMKVEGIRVVRDDTGKNEGEVIRYRVVGVFRRK